MVAPLVVRVDCALYIALLLKHELEPRFDSAGNSLSLRVFRRGDCVAASGDG